MITRLLSTILSLLLLLLVASVATGAGIDVMDLKLKKQFSHALNWENIEDHPAWVRGSEPKYDFSRKRHKIGLKPGQSVRIRMPAFACLRMERMEPDNCSVLPQVFLSNGSGMWRAAPVKTGKDGRTLYLCPGSTDPLYCRISWPDKAERDTVIALFISRLQAASNIAPYRDLLAVDGAEREFVTGTSGKRAYQRLHAGDKASFQIQGPGRVKIDSRLVYPQTASKRRQRYRLLCSIDNRSLSPLRFETRPAGGQILRLNGSPVSLGRLESRYIQIPEGNHTVRLTSSRDLLFRVLSQERPDYLVPELNAPKFMPSDLRPDWFLDRQFDNLALADICRQPYNLPMEYREKAAMKIARDNSKPGGGLLGPRLLQYYAANRPDAPELRERAEQLYLRHTYFRDLLPKSDGRELQQEYSQFISPQLDSLQSRQTVASMQHRKALANTLSSGFFTPLPQKENRLVYTVPERETPTRLQVVTYGQERPVQFMVKIGNKEPKLIQAKPAPDVPIPERKIQLPEIGLAMLQSNSSRWKTSQLGAIVSGNTARASLKQASTTTLALPADTDSISVYSLSSTNSRIALRYRDAGDYDLTQRQYLRAVKQLKTDEGLYLDLLEEFKSGEYQESIVFSESGTDHAYRSMAEHDLVNDWIPGFRMLESRAALFSAPVDPLPSEHFLRSTPRSLPGSNKLNRLQDKANSFQASGHWLPALELWCKIAASSKGKRRQKAVFSIVSALEHLGEQYLAEMMLRGIYLYPFGDDTQQMSDTAFERLQAIYKADSNFDRLLLLYATEAMQDPSSQTLKYLCRIMAARDKPKMALSLGLLLPREDQPLPIMLRSALRLDWRSLYGELVSTIEDPRAQALWRAKQRIREGDLHRAEHFLDRAGKRGGKLETNLNSALTIADQLDSSDFNTRMKGVLAWEDRQGNQNGPYYWQNSPGSITGHSGGFTLDNRKRDVEFQAYLAKSGKPVKIEVHGPTKLRLKCRPIHQKKQDQVPLNDWVTVTGNNTRRYIPITNNRPAPGLRLAGSERLPGTAAKLEFSVQAGPHTLVVEPEKRQCLVRVSVRRQQFSCGILPQLSPRNVRAVLSGPGNKMDTEPADWTAYWDSDSTIFIHPGNKTEAYSKAAILDQIPYARLDKDKVKTGRRELTSMRKTRPAGPEHALAKGDFKLALSRCGEQNPDSVRKKMNILLRMAETNSSAAEFADARARALFARHPGVNGLDTLLTRLSRGQGMKWREVETIYSGLGIRYVRVPRWSSDTPFLRVRKALLGPKSNAEEILSGAQRLLISGQNQKPGSLGLDLVYADLPFLPPANLKATWQIDDGMRKEFLFKPEGQRRKSLDIPLSRGVHSLRMKMLENKVNQFLRVKVSPGGQQVNAKFAGGLKSYQERGYFVATESNPIRATISGPTWLRIDRWNNDDVTSEYRYIKKGREQIVLGADKNGEQILYRLYQRKKDLTKKPQPLQLRDRDVQFASLDSPCFEFTEDLYQPFFDLEQDISHGRYEDGTWSAGIRSSRRRSLFEDAEGGYEPERYLEVFGTHRFYQPYKNRYFRTKLLTRYRESGGPTLGVEHETAFYPGYVPFNLRLQGRAFAQNPASDNLGYFGQGNTEWLARGEATVYQNRHISPKTYHRPSVSVFGRYLSLNSHSANASKRIDQDVYTPYKSDHQVGLSISERLVHRPWQDTIWSAGTNVSSNEGFNPLQPDNLGIWCQWNQLVYPFQIKPGYRAIHYFSDQDRDESVWQHYASLEAKCNLWLANKDRLELKSGIKMALDSDKQYSAWAGIVWHFSKDQGLQDFRPGDPSFQTLKTRQLLQKP